MGLRRALRITIPRGIDLNPGVLDFLRNGKNADGSPVYGVPNTGCQCS